MNRKYLKTLCSIADIVNLEVKQCSAIVITRSRTREPFQLEGRDNSINAMVSSMLSRANQNPESDVLYCSTHA
jgi:uncharacterized protein YukJ